MGEWTYNRLVVWFTIRLFYIRGNVPLYPLYTKLENFSTPAENRTPVVEPVRSHFYWLSYILYQETFEWGDFILLHYRNIASVSSCTFDESNIYWQLQN
jgi:hypothetical protein